MTDGRFGLRALLGMGGRRVTSSGSAGTSAVPTAHPIRRMITPVLLAVAVVAAVSILVVPVRSHMSRTAEIGAAEELLTDLVATNEADSARLSALRTDDEVERVARRDFGLAKPGEEIYHVLAPPADPPRVPDGWPFNYLGLRLALE